MYDQLEVISHIRNYTIQFVDNIQSIIQLTELSNTIVFVDQNVKRLYPMLQNDQFISIDCIESNKSIEGVDYIYNCLLKKKANINTTIIGIGGGILQDMVGFCASTYCRGINYILVPTTLLAQADSCVGGKTSINYHGKKNILGTFYPPSEIIIYTEFISTLSKIDRISGLGEIYKFYILQNNIINFDSDANIKDMIYYGLKYKIDILSRDEFDKGERKYLNFGHTFGHALEASSSHNIPHGLAVIIGCMIALTISKKLGYRVDNYESAINIGKLLLKTSGLLFAQEWFALDALLAIAKADKKSTGKLTMVLMSNFPFLEDIEDMDIVHQTLEDTYNEII